MTDDAEVVANEERTTASAEVIDGVGWVLRLTETAFEVGRFGHSQQV
jgi:hypothetical protein